MSEKPLATPRGSHADNENSHLECQTGTTAHTEPKGQFGEVSNLPVVQLHDFGVQINLTYPQFGQLRAVVDFIAEAAGEKLTFIPPLADKFTEAALVIASWSGH